MRRRGEGRGRGPSEIFGVSQGWRSGIGLGLLLSVGWNAGCSEPEPPRFAHDARLDGAVFAEKPAIRQYVIDSTEALFGVGPDALRVPPDSGFPDDGAELGRLASPEGEPGPAATAAPAVAGETGEELYRRHCLHCHGLSGDGAGPTAAFLYPRPRDYRLGLFKFTSTGYGNKPSRDDLRRTMAEGLEGTSMPAFSAMLSAEEIERVIDYVVFLSMRGEYEHELIKEAQNWDDADIQDMKDELEAIELPVVIAERWVAAREPGNETPVPNPRVAPTPESVERGRRLFLGLETSAKLECAGCHGARGLGDGPSWVDPETFNRYVFGGSIGPEPIAELEQVATSQQKRWGDEWGDPLRPSNLNRGLYKGGRRPIDLYRRIANGITGTPMFAHTSILTDPDDIWHVVNFVLALPEDPTLLFPRAGEEIELPAPSLSPAATAAHDRDGGARTASTN